MKSLPFKLIACSFLITFPLYCGADPCSPEEMSKQEKEDNAYLVSHTKPGATYSLNLANPAQYRDTVTTLNKSGKTPETAPQLFKALDASVASAKNELKLKSLNLDAAAPQLVLASATASPQDLNLILDYDQTGTNYTATALSSVVGGTNSTTIYLAIYDSATLINYGSTCQTQMGQGTDFKVSVQNTTPVPQGVTPIALAKISYSPATPALAQDLQVKYASAQLMSPANVGCMTAPNYCDTYDGNTCKTYKTACTNSAPVSTKAITACYQRTQAQGCDYFDVINVNPPKNFILPTSGNVNFTGQTLPVSPTGVWSAQIQDTSQGGGCVFALNAAMESTTNPKTGQAAWASSGSQLNWIIDPISLLPPTPCLNALANSDTLSFYLNGRVNFSTAGKSGNFTFTSTGSSSPGTFIVPPLKFLDSCLAAGTEVVMADGSKKTVDEINKDKELYTVKTGKGELRKVIGTSSGTESFPMYRIKTDKKQEVFVTRAHPLITPKGPVMARDLKPQDEILTINGTAKIDTITTENYTGRVYNLQLGETEDAKAGNSTFYANGILVGDMKTQALVEKLDKDKLVRDPAHARERLSKEWLVDFDNHIKSLQQ